MVAYSPCSEQGAQNKRSVCSTNWPMNNHNRDGETAAEQRGRSYGRSTCRVPLSLPLPHRSLAHTCSRRIELRIGPVEHTPSLHQNSHIPSRCSCLQFTALVDLFLVVPCTSIHTHVPTFSVSTRLGGPRGSLLLEEAVLNLSGSGWLRSSCKDVSYLLVKGGGGG